MIEKEHIESFLRLNGISNTASDDEIRAALVAARWHTDDVDVAILTLHGEAKEKPDASIAIARQLFRADAHVAPETLSSLLGVGVRIRGDAVRSARNSAGERGRTAMQQTGTFFTVLVILGMVAVVSILGYLYMTGYFDELIQQFALPF